MTHKGIFYPTERILGSHSGGITWKNCKRLLPEQPACPWLYICGGQILQVNAISDGICNGFYPSSELASIRISLHFELF